ncbi:MAG: ferritin-like domain-containing protein [Candidatus Micrarchaeota archaeon]
MKDGLVKALNQALATEHQAWLMYHTHASLVTGLYSEPVVERLKEIADDEKKHMDMLRARIVALGGEPTMEVARTYPASKINEMLKINIREEEKAVRMYQGILAMVDPKDQILHHALRHIIIDEQEHIEELTQLL